MVAKIRSAWQAPPEMKLPQPLSPLARRDFLIYWGGQAVSLTGTWMQQMAQSWVLASLSANARDLGLASLVGSLPVLLLSLKAGELADRVDKRRILIVTQIAMMALALAFAALIVTGQLSIPHIFVMAALLGVATAFDLPAAQSLPPELVAPQEIGRAVALMPFSALAISALGDHIGYPVVMRIAAVLFGTCGLALVAASWRPLAALPRRPRPSSPRRRPRRRERRSRASCPDRPRHRNLEWHSLHVAFISVRAVFAAAPSLAAAAFPSASAFSLIRSARASNSGPFEKSFVFCPVATSRSAAAAKAAKSSSVNLSLPIFLNCGSAVVA